MVGFLFLSHYHLFWQLHACPRCIFQSDVYARMMSHERTVHHSQSIGFNNCWLLAMQPDISSALCSCNICNFLFLTFHG